MALNLLRQDTIVQAGVATEGWPQSRLQGAVLGLA